MFNKLTNCSFVPRAILQPHTSRQQLKLIVWAPFYLLQLSTEDFGFPEVRFVFQRLVAYIQQVGTIGPHSTPASIYPHHSTETFVYRAQWPPISRSIGYLPGCVLFSLSATLDNSSMSSWSPAFPGFQITAPLGFPWPLRTSFCWHLLPYKILNVSAPWEPLPFLNLLWVIINIPKTTNPMDRL